MARTPPSPREWTWGYLHPSGSCPHEPPCTADRSRCGPQPKQAIAHASLADILFYGGAVGGGKTEYDIVEAMTICLEYPNVRVPVFRRTIKELQQWLIGRFHELVPKHVAKYNATDHYAKVFNGSELWFNYCKREQDVYNYQSASWPALFVDESTHFTETQIRYLITRVRSTIHGLQKRIRLTSNPGNVGHGWHKRWFITPVPEELGERPPPAPFEIWRPRPLPGDPTPPEKVLTRQFIPAWFHDNIALAEADPDYLAKVWALGGEKAKQLAEGDWDANDSMICGPFWRKQKLIVSTDTLLIAQGLRVGTIVPWHVWPRRDWRPPVGAKIYGSVDYGFGAPWSFHLHAVLPGGHTRTFFEFYKTRVRDEDQAKDIREALTREKHADGTTPLMEGLEWIVMDPSMWNSREETGRAKSIAEVYQDTMPRVQFMRGAAGRGARMSRPNRWMDALSLAPDGFPWWGVTAACPDLIRTVPEVPWDQDDPDVEDDASENHAYEDVGRFFEARPHAPRVPPPDPFAHLDPISAQHQRALAARDNPKRTGVLGGLGKR
jgi:hypothetical protein